MGTKTIAARELRPGDQVVSGSLVGGDLWLHEHRLNIFSQNGEDGVIAAILARLPATNDWCVEFGAWDGRHLSNTAALIQSGYRAVMIEGDHNRFDTLRENYADNPGVIAVNAFVGFDANTGLDHILASTALPLEFDLLSIDIDGNDYHVWDALRGYAPKVVCIEFNPTIPPEIAFVQPRDMAVKQGSSAAALAALGKEKGYEIACILGCNCIFVRNDLYSLLGISDNSVERQFIDRGALTYIFSGYDGTIFLRGYGRLPWHGESFDADKMQTLPVALRSFPPDYSRWQKIVHRLRSRLHRIGR